MKLKGGTFVKMCYNKLSIDKINRIISVNPIIICPKPPKGLWWNWYLDSDLGVIFVLSKIQGFKKSKSKKLKK